jgi:hypothetical protein
MVRLGHAEPVLYPTLILFTTKLQSVRNTPGDNRLYSTLLAQHRRSMPYLLPNFADASCDDASANSTFQLPPHEPRRHTKSLETTFTSSDCNAKLKRVDSGFGGNGE